MTSTPTHQASAILLGRLAADSVQPSGA